MLPCSIAFVAFQYIAYCFPTMIVEANHIKGLDFSSPFDRKIPLLTGFIAVYGPSVITWVFMPYVIYGLYGRKHFFRYFSITLIYSAVCFVLYILVPTEAILQREEVKKSGVALANSNIFDKLTVKTYVAAAPYGEAPSGH
ncbi:hypothetical protein FACS1894218_5530 [Bacilli bacterium]|nr:hypothetical protein FACS1894218_5530 [Bacilli bacterium]